MTRNINAARAEAVFVSTLDPSTRATRREVKATITQIVRAQGLPAIAARVAEEFGDHPDLAAARMTWARTLVDWVYSPRHVHTKPYPWRHTPLNATTGSGAR